MKNYYKMMNLNKNATSDEIKSAYRDLAKLFHPDVGGDKLKFADIKEAYETLSDLSSKKAYDSELNKHPFDGEDYRTVIVKPKEIKKDVYDDVKDVLTRRFGFNKKLKLNTRIEISENEAGNGVNIEVEIPYKTACEKCFGFGDTVISKCSKCKGAGFIKDSMKGHFRVNPGISHNDVMKIKENGLELNAKIIIK